MRDKLEAIKAEALAKIESAEVVSTLNDVKVAILGKKGELTQVLKSMKDVAPEDRPKVGQWVNETREAVEKLLDEKVKKFEAEALKRKYESEKIDVTMPAKRSKKGNLHPVTQVK
ncbi:MAG: phenylalanine--tRNA ligase subunit alpha, partial [Coprococcus sp.]